eukprot:CAMPEP_0202854072 /NCGR_PEP_ID=MMETSP1389-20130828/90811_1 /ASSEMBLY_ACC=CAM_ASM_000865 /TAXON_ID=302021 /ORGANISM="Rhodomonas sp., Strain CCMP768" /LENGTH=407 /DNA_ID=CAMNT_0049532647 /DNA_START=115 /DNA_END=1339 /DNA_ORIENTATION=-
MSAGDPSRKRAFENEEFDEIGKRQQIAPGVGVEQGQNVMVKILVQNKLAGGVIGKAGATINSIKEASGARVKVSNNQETFPGTNDRIILIQGSINTVLTASRLVVAELAKQEPQVQNPETVGDAFAAGAAPPASEAPMTKQEPQVQNPETVGDAFAAGAAPPASEAPMTIVVVIPAQACGLIIGKGGERINALREQCQAKIQLQSKDRIIQGLDERTVTINGNLLNAQMAVEKVILILYEDGNVHYNNQGTNYGAFSSIGRGQMGLGGQSLGGQSLGGQSLGNAQQLALLQQQQLALAGLPVGYDYGAALGLPQQAPPQAAPVDAGAGQVQMRLAIPELTVGLLVGKGGNIIKELMHLSGANIKVSQKGDVVPGTTNRIVTITGNPVASNYAHMLVLQKVPTATSIQ